VGGARPLSAVARISCTAVRTFRLDHPDEVVLGPEGFEGNRRFLLVNGDGERLRSSATSWPIVLRAELDPRAGTLRVVFPGGVVHEASARGSGERLWPQVGDERVAATVVPGPWEPGLADLAGHPVRIARLERPLDAFGLHHAVTLVSEGSLRALSELAGGPVDARRFRMLFELSGCDAHEEDGWNGRQLRVGGAILRVGGPVARCAFTTRHPETGARDLDTLRLIASYRGRRDGDGAILFGVYADVEQPGVVRVGDAVELL
jgi:uncharacterized protein YcbX